MAERNPKALQSTDQETPLEHVSFWVEQVGVEDEHILLPSGTPPNFAPAQRRLRQRLNEHATEALVRMQAEQVVRRHAELARAVDQTLLPQTHEPEFQIIPGPVFLQTHMQEIQEAFDFFDRVEQGLEDPLSGREGDDMSSTRNESELDIDNEIAQKYQESVEKLHEEEIRRLDQQLRRQSEGILATLNQRTHEVERRMQRTNLHQRPAVPAHHVTDQPEPKRLSQRPLEKQPARSEAESSRAATPAASSSSPETAKGLLFLLARAEEALEWDVVGKKRRKKLNCLIKELKESGLEELAHKLSFLARTKQKNKL